MKSLIKTIVCLLFVVAFTNTVKSQMGIGITTPTHPLTVVSSADPLRFLGLAHNATIDTVLVINPSGVVYKRAYSTFAWSTTGNANTNPSTNFIGTTDSVDFVIKVNNNTAGRFIVGKRSFEGGRNSSASGINSFVFGFSDSVAANYSFATGYDNDVFANAEYSATFGRKNTVNSTAAYGVTTGELNILDAVHTSAHGENLKANSYNLFVVGSYNDTNLLDTGIRSNYPLNALDSTNHIFVVGNGHQVCGGSNVITATWAGNVGISNKDPRTTLDVFGGFSIRPRTINTIGTTATVTSNNFAYTVHNRSYLRINSDGSPATRSLVLSDGLQTGQFLIIECITAGGINGIRIVDNVGTHNTNTSGTLDLYESDIIGLLWNGTDWVQMFYNNN